MQFHGQSCTRSVKLVGNALPWKPWPRPKFSNLDKYAGPLPNYLGIITDRKTCPSKHHTQGLAYRCFTSTYMISSTSLYEHRYHPDLSSGKLTRYKKSWISIKQKQDQLSASFEDQKKKTWVNLQQPLGLSQIFFFGIIEDFQNRSGPLCVASESSAETVGHTDLSVHCVRSALPTWTTLEIKVALRLNPEI